MGGGVGFSGDVVDWMIEMNVGTEMTDQAIKFAQEVMRISGMGGGVRFNGDVVDWLVEMNVGTEMPDVAIRFV